MTAHLVLTTLIIMNIMNMVTSHMRRRISERLSVSQVTELVLRLRPRFSDDKIQLLSL